MIGSQRNIQLPVTISLVAMSSLVFFSTSPLFSNGDPSRLSQWLIGILRFSNYQAPLWFLEIRSGEIWRIFSPMFLHVDGLHFAFNMLWLWTLGARIENLETSRRLLAIVLLSAAIAHTGFYCLAGPSFGGMSGVIYALFGYAWYLHAVEGRTDFEVDDRELSWILGSYIVFLALTAFGYLRVANSIHALGAVVGILFAWLSSSNRIARLKLLFRKGSGRLDWAALCVLLIAAAFFVDWYGTIS